MQDLMEDLGFVLAWGGNHWGFWEEEWLIFKGYFSKLCIEYPRGQRQKQKAWLDLHTIRQAIMAAWVLVVPVEMVSFGSCMYSEGSTKYREWDKPKLYLKVDFPGALVVKNRPANAGDIRDVGSIPGLGRSPGGGPGNPLRYSCLEKPMDRGAWQAIESQSRTRLKRLSTHACTHT